MSKAIKGGMYAGENPVGKQISLDPRTVMITQPDGQVVEIPSMAYVRDLERQILELRRSLGIVESDGKSRDGTIRALNAGIRKVDAKLR